MTRHMMNHNSQTRKYTSGQPFDEDYQVWLSGYWEDFTSSYSLPEASSNTLNLSDTHFGNPLNAEARLNPHYRWSYADRTSTYSGATVYGAGMVTNDIKELHNLSMAEWFSVDPVRLGKGRDFTSKINNEYLDSHAHSNRYRLGGKGELDSYILMTTSHVAGGKYIIDNGEIDSSFARSDSVGYNFSQTAGITGAVNTSYASSNGAVLNAALIDYSEVFNDSGQDAKVFRTVSASTTGSFTIDTAPTDILTTGTWSSNQHAAYILGAEIKSPSRTPFLAIRNTMPVTHRINGDVAPTGTDGVWRYTGAKRELHHFRVGDIVQVGKHDEYAVIQAFNSDKTSITKLYSLSRNQLLNVSKFKSTSGDYIEGGASESNVDIRKWFEPVMTYDGSLNCVGDGDTFHIRYCPLVVKSNGLPDSDRVAHYILRVGFDSSRLNMTSKGNRYELSGSDYNPSHSCAAIQFEIQPHSTSEAQKIDHNVNLVRVSSLDSSIASAHKQSFIDYDATSTITTPNYSNEWQQWMDIDVVMDFTNQRYKVYVDGFESGTFNFETKPSGGSWVASDLYGWHMDHASLQKDGSYTPDNGGNEYALTAGKFWGPKSEITTTMWTLIDRAGIVNEITNPVRNSPNSIVAANDLSIQEITYDAGINETSRLSMLIIDDDNERQIQDIFSSSPSEWMVLLFKNGIDSIYWNGFLDKVRVTQDGKKKTRTIQLISRDAIGRLDGIMPYWEVGQNELTISTNYKYREAEARMVSENFYFGARALLRGNETIGMDHQTRAKDSYASTTEIGAISGYYTSRYDQRTRLYSANPIQMYVGQDDFGPKVDSDVYNTAPTAEHSDKNIWRQWNTRKILGFSDGRSMGQKYIVAHCIEHGLSVNDEFKIYGEHHTNAFTTTSAGVNGLDIVVKKIIDIHHFAFEYKSSVGNIFGHLGDEAGHFWSVITRHTDKHGLGFDLGSTSPYTYTGWAQGNFSSNSARGLIPISQNFATGMGRFDASNTKQWSSYYTNNVWTLNDNQVVTSNIAATEETIDNNSDGQSDSFINNTVSKAMSIQFDNGDENYAPTGVPNFRGYTSYQFKPLGVIELKHNSIYPLIDLHGLGTVGPLFNFNDGRLLPTSSDAYDYRHALEYVGTIGTTFRSQLFSIVDYYRAFRKTLEKHSSNGREIIGTPEGTVSQAPRTTGVGIDYNLRMLIRGNDIDQRDPHKIPSLSVTENSLGASDTYEGRATNFIQRGNTGIKITAQSGSGSNIQLTITTSQTFQLPFSGFGTFGPNGTAQGLFRWTGVDDTNHKLTGVTILASGSTSLAQHISNNTASLTPFIFPVISTNQALFTPPTARQPKQQYRVAHASYMHDIASSMWFRMVFGIIEEQAAGVDGPPHNEKARRGNKLSNMVGNSLSGWHYQEREGESNDLYTTQYSDYFTLRSAYTAGGTTLVLDKATPPLIDENFKDRRYIDKGSLSYDTGTDPLISIPSRANAHSTKRQMLNGGLVFEIENPNGTLDVGAARSAQMTSCADDTASFTHWEIVKLTQSEIVNTLKPNTADIDENNSFVGGDWTMPNKSTITSFPGPIVLTAAHNPSNLLTGNKPAYTDNRLFDPDFFHSGNDEAVSGARMFQSLDIGDIIFVGNTQGTITNQPITGSLDSHYNVDNHYGEDRDFVSYRWYRILDKATDHSTITIFPAEYSYCNHDLQSDNGTYINRHPVGMHIVAHDAVGQFKGWYNKLKRGADANDYQGDLPSGFPTVKQPICKIYSGDITISGVKHLKNNHLAGAKGRFRRIRNNFNHVWLNWADMRNDGSADADGSFRQSKFGLLYPTEEQYSVDLVFSSTQADITSLGIGSDVDLWELTDTDPFTNGAWSANYNNKITNMTHLHDWESKAGAPIAVDASKYFNLNTMTNNGKIGQTSGGTKNIADYDYTVSGNAQLMDNYWWQAGPHPYTAKYRHPYDPNFQFYVRYETRLAEDLDGKPLMLIDSSNLYHGSYFNDTKSVGIMESVDADDDQLNTFTYKMGGCFVNKYDENQSNAQRLYMGLGAEKVDKSVGVWTDPIGYSMGNTQSSENNSGGIVSNGEHTVYNAWASQMGLGSMMVMQGHVESRGSNTYYDHDKIRIIFQSHNTESWLSGSQIPCSYDINNVPISYDMTIDSFGSVMDGRGTTTLRMISNIRKSSGNGDAGNYQAFNYMIGRNGRFEYRPTYNSGISLTRNDLNKSDVDQEARAQFTHVRIYYNNGESFVDTPTPILDGSQVKFKMLNLPSVRSSTEATAAGDRELERVRDKEITVLATIKDDTKGLFTGGLYGYISTPLVQCLSGLASSYGSFFPHGNLTGQIIGGRQNAMDGNLDATNSSLIGATSSMAFLDTGSGNHGGGGCNTYDTHATKWYGQYTPYGIHCIEKAVQIVHIPKGVPKVSTGSNQKLRMFITHKSASANGAEFRLWLIDSHFDSQRRQGYTGNNPLTTAKISYLDITKNGFHEISFPTSYGAPSGAKMIVSFNKEYCMDLLKYRSNHTTSSKSNKGNRVTTLPSTDVSLLDLSHGNPVNEASAFPLGLSLYYRPHGSEDSQGRQGPLWQLRPRALYYAPSVEIVDDFAYRVGTDLNYNDDHLSINTSLTVSKLNWKIKEQDNEELELRLIKNKSQEVKYLSLGVGTTPTPPQAGNPPSNGGNGLPGGGLGDQIPYLPGDDIGGAPGWGGLKPPQRGGMGSQHELSGGITKASRISNISGAPVQNVGGLGSTMTGSKVGISKMSKGATNTIKGIDKIDGERWTNKQVIKNKSTSKEAIGQVKSTSSGSAVIGADGFTLPGVSALFADGTSIPAKADYHEGSTTITVPSAVSNDKISVVLTVKAPLTGGGSKYTLFSTLECIETGEMQRKVVSITADDTPKRIALFTTRKLIGAGTVGNRIKITVGRVPGGGLLANPDGDDDSPFSSMKIKSIEVSFNETSKGKDTGIISTRDKITTKDNTQGFMSGTDKAWDSKTSDATFDASGNVVYTRKGKAASNALRKSDGTGGYSEDVL